MKKLKTVVLYFLSLIVFISGASPICSAASPGTITPFWNNVQNINSQFVFYDNVGECTVSTRKGSNCTSLEGVLTIFELSDGEWVYVDSITSSTTRTTLAMMLEITGESGVEYKMELVIKAYSGTSIIEEITDVKYATCS